MLTEGELKAIDEVRQVYCSSDTDAVFLDYVLARLRKPRAAEGPHAGGSFDDPAIEPDPWAPYVDCRVRDTTNGKLGTVRSFTGNCADVVYDDGGFAVLFPRELEPAPPRPEGPTADEMFNWLRDTKTDLEHIEDSGWRCWNDDRCGDPVITKRHDDPRDAVRAAMEIGVLG